MLLCCIHYHSLCFVHVILDVKCQFAVWWQSQPQCFTLRATISCVQCWVSRWETILRWLLYLLALLQEASSMLLNSWREVKIVHDEQIIFFNNVGGLLPRIIFFIPAIVSTCNVILHKFSFVSYGILITTSFTLNHYFLSHFIPQWVQRRWSVQWNWSVRSCRLRNSRTGSWPAAFALRCSQRVGCLCGGAWAQRSYGTCPSRPCTGTTTSFARDGCVNATTSGNLHLPSPLLLELCLVP